MSIMEILLALLGVAGAIIFSLFKTEQSKRKVAEKEIEVKAKVIDELETEALNLNQRAESAQVLQEIEHERRRADEQARISARGKRKPLGRMHDDTD